MDSNVSPWSGLDSEFLRSRSIADQVRIFDLTARTAQVLHRWSARYPLMRRARVWPLALAVAASAPFADLEALVTVARLDLWIFTLDDLFDEERIPHAQLLEHTRRYRAIVRGAPPDQAGDSLASALQDVRQTLAKFRLFDTLAEDWSAAFDKTVDAMIDEYIWRRQYRQPGNPELPDFESYLDAATYSISVPPHAWAMLIAIDDPSVTDHLDHLHRMVALASRCIRLSNDLRTFAKELLESKVNAVLILSQALMRAGVAEAAARMQAESQVQAEIERGLRALAELREQGRTRTGRPEAAIADIARFACEFYAHHDFHTFLQERR